jgi:phosphocarrier protein HPr
MSAMEAIPSCVLLVEVINMRGLHARAAARFVRLAETLDAQVEVRHAQRSVVGTSLMGLLLLGAGKGSTLEIICQGRAAHEACETLADLVRRRFDEES